MRRLAPLLLLGAVACTPGPRPDETVALPPAPAAETIAPASGPAQQLVPAAPVDPVWWRRFNSPALDALVARALVANNDIATADANLRQAHEQALAQAGASRPQIDASLDATHYRVSRVLSPPLNDPNNYIYSLITPQVSVSYSPDVFGLNRNRVRSARAQADVAANRLLAARITVSSNVVNAAVEHAMLAAQVEAAEEAIQSNREVLDLIRQRQRLGDLGLQDVASQQTAFSNAEAALPPLQRQLEHQEAVIAVLIGVAPGGALPALPTLDTLTLPATLPVALPSAVVANRPDVRAAEAQMRGAAADVGAAIAARLPQFPLTANIGDQALRFGDLFASGTPFWTLIGSVTQPLFHGGQLRHQQRAAEAELTGAEAQYRQAALNAFGDVADALSGLRTDATALDAAQAASDAAQRNLLFTRRQLQLGGVGTLTLLNAEASAAQAANALVQARAARLTDTVALFQAVGGGVVPRS